MHQCILLRVKGLFGDQYAQKIHQPVLIQLRGQLYRLLIRIHSSSERIATHLFASVSRQSILRVFQRRQQGLFVIIQRLLLARVLDVDVGQDAPRREYLPLHRRAGISNNGWRTQTNYSRKHFGGQQGR